MNKPAPRASPARSRPGRPCGAPSQVEVHCIVYYSITLLLLLLSLLSVVAIVIVIVTVTVELLDVEVHRGAVEVQQLREVAEDRFRPQKVHRELEAALGDL